MLTVTEMLRQHGVVDKFVEFFGDGLANLPLADRATIGNMSPEFGSTCALFPIDEETIRYLRLSGRPPEQIALVEAYAKTTGLWRVNGAPAADYTAVLELDLASVEPSLAGPSRPQDRVPLRVAKSTYQAHHQKMAGERARKNPAASGKAPATVDGRTFEVSDGAVLIAAITSCTNTSNPYVLIAAGLLARNARRLGITAKPWVKTSLAPGSRVVTDYLRSARLLDELAGIGFNLVGYGCTTCIGNSGPLKPEISAAIKAGDVIGCAVLSGNRNFDGRVHPEVKMNFLASPPLVVAYALAGSLNVDLNNEPLGTDERRQAGLPARCLARAPGDRRLRAAEHHFRDVPPQLRRRVRRRRTLAVDQGTGRQGVRLGRQVHLREESALLRRHDDGAGRGRRDSRRPRPGAARRFGHHRSHFAGRQHRARRARRQST